MHKDLQDFVKLGELQVQIDQLNAQKENREIELLEVMEALEEASI